MVASKVARGSSGEFWLFFVAGEDWVWGFSDERLSEVSRQTTAGSHHHETTN